MDQEDIKKLTYIFMCERAKTTASQLTNAYYNALRLKKEAGKDIEKEEVRQETRLEVMTEFGKLGVLSAEHLLSGIKTIGKIVDNEAMEMEKAINDIFGKGKEGWSKSSMRV